MRMWLPILTPVVFTPVVFTLVVPFAALPGPSAAQPAPGRQPRLVVGELFTSQGCSSCPPADARVAELARTRPDLLMLTFHVTYWDRLGWHDPFSLQAATDRQRRYVALGVSPEVYTPAMVVDGRLDAVGSDAAAVDRALARAAQDRVGDAALDIRRGPSGLTVSVGAGSVGAADGEAALLLVGYDPLHRTAVGRGENGGRTLEEANVVRSLSVLAARPGRGARFEVPSPAGEEVAVLLQRDDGRIVAAATTHTADRPAPQVRSAVP